MQFSTVGALALLVAVAQAWEGNNSVPAVPIKLFAGEANLFLSVKLPPTIIPAHATPMAILGTASSLEPHP